MNNLQAYIPQLLASGLDHLREMARMPAAVTRRYEQMAGPVGSSIDIPLPPEIAVQPVVPSATAPATADLAPGSISLNLDQWHEAAFYMTDQDYLEVERGLLPSAAQGAIKALANFVDKFILAKAAGFYGIAGTTATSAFSAGIPDIVDARTRLNQQLCPDDGARRVVVSPIAEGHALQIPAFHDASFGVGGKAILKGELTERFGFGWMMDQNVLSHTSGAAVGALINDAGAALAVGDKALPVDGISGGTILKGDVLSIAGSTQTYVATADIAGGVVAIEPGLVEVPADNAAITVLGDHELNLAFHPEAIAFASRPLLGTRHPGSLFEQLSDPLSGISLRLEVTREHKRDRFSYDILFGAEIIRREFGCRVLGPAS